MHARIDVGARTSQFNMCTSKMLHLDICETGVNMPLPQRRPFAKSHSRDSGLLPPLPGLDLALHLGTPRR
jgi:hypothetical protein